MAKVKLPAGAEAAFRFEYADSFGETFTIHVYGAGRYGWFVASLRGIESRDSGRQDLKKGEWPMLLDMIGRCGFWALPETLPDPANCTVDDGDTIRLTGRDRERHHEIWRFVWREPGLDRLHMFLRRVSGLFPPENPPTTPNEEGSATHSP